MTFFKSQTSNNNLSPKQFYFPYFFNYEEFNDSINQFGLKSQVVFNDQEKIAGMPKCLIIESSEDILTVDFWSRLMIDRNNNLIIWKDDEDVLNISIFALPSINQHIQLQIDIGSLKFGENQMQGGSKLVDFVTFVRRPDLKYNLDYYDNFAIIIINDSDIEFIPFNWFNEKGGDYGYVWPAIAQIDVSKKILKGSGMRMANFEIDLYQPSKSLII